MIKNNNVVELKYSSFVFNILLQLGLSPSCKGTYYLRDIILLAIKYNDFVNIDTNLRELREILAKECNNSAKSIKSNIEYTIKYINYTKAKANFKKLFGLDYDIYFITPKSIIGLILTLIQNNTMSEKNC